MPEPLRIVSIGGHPADTFDQSGGTMAHHAARGDYVAAVGVTAGARIHDKKVSDEMFHREEIPDAPELTHLMGERGDVKADEVRRACRILGFEDVFFLGADAAVLVVDAGVIRLVHAIHGPQQAAPGRPDNLHLALEGPLDVLAGQPLPLDGADVGEEDARQGQCAAFFTKLVMTVVATGIIAAMLNPLIAGSRSGHSLYASWTNW